MVSKTPPVLLILLLGALAAPAGAQTPADERLARLGVALDTIRGEVRFQRNLGGGLLVGAGVLTGTAGAFGAVSAHPGDSDVEPELRNRGLLTSVVQGSLYAGTGLLVLLLKDENETLPERFSAAPAETPEQRARKVLVGEVTLRSLAEKGRAHRFWTAGLQGLAGGALAALSLTRNDGRGPASHPALSLGGAVLGMGVLTLVFESTPERELRTYEDWAGPSPAP